MAPARPSCPRRKPPGCAERLGFLGRRRLKPGLDCRVNACAGLYRRIEGVGPGEHSVRCPARFQDGFGDPGLSPAFLRDAEGRVVALERTTARARRVRFDRVPQAAP